MCYLLILFTINLNGMGNPVRSHVWQKRVLIVSASSPTNIGYKRQNQLLERGKKGMKDREMVIYRLYSDHWLDPSNDLLSKEEADAIHREYNIEKGTFSVTLIGKDGGVKLKKTDIISPRELFQLIDSMPIRRNEIEKQKESGY